jgi:hypothetical protein
MDHGRSEETEPGCDECTPRRLWETQREHGDVVVDPGGKPEQQDEADGQRGASLALLNRIELSVERLASRSR